MSTRRRLARKAKKRAEKFWRTMDPDIFAICDRPCVGEIRFANVTAWRFLR